MQDVINTLKDHEERFSLPEEERTTREFTNAAKGWANHCFETYTGELLRKGLDVSTAMAAFEEEMLHGNGGK